MNTKGVALPVLIIGIVVVGVIVVSVVSKLRGRANPVTEVAQKATKVITGGAGFDFDESTPGYENYTKLLQGCPFKDCIPSIDDPVFESVSEADVWLSDYDFVFALDY